VSSKIFELAFYLRIFFNVEHLTNIDEWESIGAINMRGPVLCYKYAAIQMAKQNSGGRMHP
jgi:NAD(P)-dependent dehydrogenase (short-subunit alcohol dehydrogenase family)